jgi:hypothetical protein
MGLLTTFGISSLTFLIGLWVGNRLAIGRDKRREVNASIQPIREMLVQEIERPPLRHEFPSAPQIDAVAQRLGRFERNRFLVSVERYKTARSDRKSQYRQDEVGKLFYEPTEELKTAIDRLLNDFLFFR